MIFYQNTALKETMARFSLGILIILATQLPKINSNVFGIATHVINIVYGLYDFEDRARNLLRIYIGCYSKFHDPENLVQDVWVSMTCTTVRHRNITRQVVACNSHSKGPGFCLDKKKPRILGLLSAGCHEHIIGVITRARRVLHKGVLCYLGALRV